MKIVYLNHDTRHNTGAGKFYNSFSAAAERTMPGAEIRVLTSEDLIYPNKLKLLLALPAIRRILKNCDLIHALDGWPYGVIAALASLGLKKKLIITAIGTGAVQPLHRPVEKWLMSWAYRRADRLVAVSHNTRHEILKVLPDLNIEVIPHGVDLARFQTVSAGYQREAEKFKPYILSVGTLKQRKGFDYSLEAFAKIAGEFPNLKYVIVGGGPEKLNLESRIKNYGLEGRVIFLQNLHQDYLNALYQNAELFILLSQDVGKDIEGFGLVFLEAAAGGLPVIASKGTSAEDAVLDGRNGFLVPPQDAAAAAEMMRLVLRDKNLRQKMMSESLAFAKEMTWQRAAEEYRRIYAALF